MPSLSATCLQVLKTHLQAQSHEICELIGDRPDLESTAEVQGHEMSFATRTLPPSGVAWMRPWLSPELELSP